MKNAILLILLIVFNTTPYYSCEKHNCSEHIVLNDGAIDVRLTGDESNAWENHIPWIVAVFLGVLTVIVNLKISSNAQKIATRNAELDFNKSVLSENRQAWINTLRDLISEILTKTYIGASKGDMSYDEYEQLTYLITKAELMLNAETDKEYINSLKELNKCLVHIMAKNKEFKDISPLRNKVRKMTQTTLKTEWERVKRGE